MNFGILHSFLVANFHTHASKNLHIGSNNFLLGFRFQAQTGELFRLLHAYFTCQVPQDIEKKVYFHTFARLSRRDSTIKPKDPKVSFEGNNSRKMIDTLWISENKINIIK